MAATSRVTREVLDSYLRCKTKGFLTLAGRHGIESDYERWRIESGERQRFRATVNLLVRYRGYQVSKGIVLLASRTERRSRRSHPAGQVRERTHFDEL